MTHNVHPYAHRLGILRDWKSRWFSSNPRVYRECIKMDVSIREFLKKRLRGMYVSSIEMERNQNMLRVIIKTSRPGIVIGRSGEGSIKIKAEILKLIKKFKFEDMPEIKIDVEEVRSPESNAAIVSQMIAEGLEKHMPFRRVLKQTAEKVMANRDVEGIRIAVSGRLGGAEMARREKIKKGRIPLQTFRADIDFAREEARLPYGIVGIKVWIYRGDIFSDKKEIKSL
ncbi:MAG TPA: 30S ribosomal protein S3 [Candidatus Kaiserbacteria bacterium]|nr:30S ribosomal protein S3 [Candidatus Kaiserbacteria bacterium]